MRFSGQEKFFIKTNSLVRRQLQTGLGCCDDKHMACMLRLHAGTLQIKGGKGAGKKYGGMEEFTGSKERSTQSQQQQAAVLEIAVDKKQSTSCFTTCLIYITVDLKQDVLPFQKKSVQAPKIFKCFDDASIAIWFVFGESHGFLVSHQSQCYYTTPNFQEKSCNQ